MMVGCPGWEYDQSPARGLLKGRVAALLLELAQNRPAIPSRVADTRPTHGTLFAGLTPEGFPHYAGHYRGEQLPCLEQYEVMIPSDPRVGHPAHGVCSSMHGLRTLVACGFAGLDAAEEGPPAPMTADARLQLIVAFAAEVFQRFLTIHPYANGNGHAARYIAWAVLVRYGYFPKKFTIDPRPSPDNAYVQAISEHRGGNREPLERLILESLA